MTDTQSLPDFSKRDETIRHLTYTPLYRREGVPYEDFAAYWRDVHGPLCARLPGLGYYVQHHFDRTRSANLWPRPEGVEPIGVVLDGMVEIGFSSKENQATFQEASPLLFKDEQNFLGQTVAYELPNGSRTIVDRDPDPVPNHHETRHHLHLHIHGKEGVSFGDWVETFAVDLSKEDGIVKVRLHRPEPYDNEEPQPKAPRVDHQLQDKRKTVAIIEICWANRMSAQRYLKSERYASVAADLANHVEAMAPYFVSGVYTFIRDGVLTTAGLRGSRTAVLIDRIGAANQIEHDVTRLFGGRS